MQISQSEIYNSDKEIEIGDEDVTMIKSIIKQSSPSTLVQGQIEKLLDKKEEVKK